MSAEGLGLPSGGVLCPQDVVDGSARQRSAAARARWPVLFALV